MRQRGAQGAAAPQGWARLKQGTAKPRANLRAQLLLVRKVARGKAQEEGCSAGDKSLLSPAPCLLLPQRQDRQEKPPAGSLAFRLYHKSEAGIKKNSIFSFSGASAPARGWEQSREAPTLPAAPAAAKDALTATPGPAATAPAAPICPHTPRSPGPGGAGGCASRCSGARILFEKMESEAEQGMHGSAGGAEKIHLARCLCKAGGR